MYILCIHAIPYEITWHFFTQQPPLGLRMPPAPLTPGVPPTMPRPSLGIRPLRSGAFNRPAIWLRNSLRNMWISRRLVKCPERGWKHQQGMKGYVSVFSYCVYKYIYIYVCVYRLLFTGFSHISLSYRLRLDTPRFWLVAFKATLGASGGDGFLLDVGISLWYWYNLYLSARVSRGFVSRGTAQQHLNLGHDSQGFDYSICFHFIKLVDPKASQNPQSSFSLEKRSDIP